MLLIVLCLALTIMGIFGKGIGRQRSGTGPWSQVAGSLLLVKIVGLMLGEKTVQASLKSPSLWGRFAWIRSRIRFLGQPDRRVVAWLIAILCRCWR